MFIKDVPVGSIVRVYVDTNSYIDQFAETDCTISATLIKHDTDQTSLLCWKDRQQAPYGSSNVKDADVPTQTIITTTGGEFEYWKWVGSRCLCLWEPNQQTDQPISATLVPTIPDPIQPSFDFNAYNQTLPNGNVITSIVRS